MYCKIEVREGSGSAEIKRFLKELGGASVSVGWDTAEEANKAYINELGAIKTKKTSNGKVKNVKIPPRPFITPSIVIAKERELPIGFRSEMRRSNPKNAFRKLGEWFREILIRKINSIWEPPLSKLTIKMREENKQYIEAVDKPLVETGKMRDSIVVKQKDV